MKNKKKFNDTISEDQKKLMDEPLLKFYDLVIRMNSFKQLEKEGWPIIWNEKSKKKYEQMKNENCVIVGVAGNKNRGKSFLLGKITDYKVYGGYLDTTEGISINFPNFGDDKEKKLNVITLDTAGRENPILNSEYSDDKKKISETEFLNEIRLLSRDQLICEDTLSGFIMENCSVLIIVLEQLSYVEQIVLNSIINKMKNYHNVNKLIVVHNLKNIQTVNEINNFVDDILLKSLTFSLSKASYDKFKKNVNQNNFYYQQRHTQLDIFHLIIGDEYNEEIKNYFNKPAFKFIREEIRIAKQKQIVLLEDFRKYIIIHSKEFLEEKGFDDNELVFNDLDKIEGTKIKLEKRKNLKLKGINTDEKGFSNFYTSTIEPSYSFDIYENNNNEFILEVQAELYGNINPNEINYNKERITDNFYITITGKLQSENMNYHPKRNLKFNEFSIQIKLESEIALSQKKLFIYEINEKPFDIQYDEKYGIVTILFNLNAEFMENQVGGYGGVDL